MTPLLLALSIGATELPYDGVVATIEHDRRALAVRYARARRPEDRRAALAAARARVLEAVTDQIVPAWEGTEWAMSGRTPTPGRGTIACGTFVGTVLRDAGFRLNRIRMGQLASEHIALSLTSERNLRRYSDRPAEAVIRDVEAWGPGLYAVGLDTHAGLIVVGADRHARFVHASFYGTGGVMDEPLRGDNPFDFSRYRVVARLLDDTMMRRWLQGHWFAAVKPG